MEDREIGVLEETGRCSEEGDRKLQGDSVDIGDVEVLRVLSLFFVWQRQRLLRAERGLHAVHTFRVARTFF